MFSRESIENAIDATNDVPVIGDLRSMRDTTLGHLRLADEAMRELQNAFHAQLRRPR